VVGEGHLKLPLVLVALVVGEAEAISLVALEQQGRVIMEVMDLLAP
jgi:hypothetical protein